MQTDLSTSHFLIVKNQATEVNGPYCPYPLEFLFPRNACTRVFCFWYMLIAVESTLFLVNFRYYINIWFHEYEHNREASQLRQRHLLRVPGGMSGGPRARQAEKKYVYITFLSQYNRKNAFSTLSQYFVLTNCDKLWQLQIFTLHFIGSVPPGHGCAVRGGAATVVYGPVQFTGQRKNQS